MDIPALPDWERLLAAERHLQYLVARSRAGWRHSRRDACGTSREPRRRSSPLTEVAERLAGAAPGDMAAIDLASYRGLRAPWTDWAHVAGLGRAWAPVVARAAMESRP